MDTVIVHFTMNMSGGRYDDRAWPPAWTDFEVPRWEADGLIKAGMARFVRMGEPDAPPLPAPAAENEKVMSSPAQTAEGPVAPDDSKLQWGAEERAAAEEAAQTPGTDTGETSPPPSASKQDWILYAVRQGADDDTVGNMTKQQLMEQYGARP